MRTMIGIAAAAFAASTLAAECKDGACPLPAAGGEVTYTVLSPVPESAVEPIKTAPRLKSLDGKTIALVGGSFMANVTHPELKRLILAESDKSAFIVTGDPSRNKSLCVPGGGFSTVKITLPKAWDALMAERGYKPLADFRLATDLKPDTPQATRQNWPRPTARGEGRGGSGAGGAWNRPGAQGSERGHRGPPSSDQRHRRSRRFRENAPQDAPRQ